MKDKIHEARERCEGYRLQGFHCSESAIRSCAEVLNITLPEELLKVSSGFRGGGGGYGDRCGVIEAGIILISYLYGRTDPENDVSDYSYLIRVLHNRFIEELGSYTCRVLKPFAFHLSGTERNCSYVYKKGAAIIAKTLLEAEELLRAMPESEKYQKPR